MLRRISRRLLDVPVAASAGQASVATQATNQNVGSVTLTQIQNGPAVATKNAENSGAGRLAIAVKGGPVYENKWTAGVSHFIRRMAFRDNLIASNWRLDTDWSLAGVSQENFCAGLVSKKHLLFTLSGGSDTLAQQATIDHLFQCVLFPRFHERDIGFYREHVLADEKKLMWENPAEYTRRLIVNTAFAGSPAGNPIFVPAYNGDAIGSTTLWDWWEKYVSVQELAVIGYNVNQDALLDNLCQSNYLQMTHNAGPKPVAIPSNKYVGGTTNNIIYKQASKDLQWVDSDDFVGVGFQAPGLNDTPGRVQANIAVQFIQNEMNANSDFTGGRRTQVQYEGFDDAGIITVVMRNATAECMAKLKGIVQNLQNLTAQQLTAAKKGASIRIYRESNQGSAVDLIAQDLFYAPAKPFVLDGDASQVGLVNAVTGTQLSELSKAMLTNPTVVANGGNRDTPLSF